MYLEKITLNNIRRFGENVEIELAKGATIFLAPNGTGKTAIFEAVELALTGGVRRLPQSTDPIIRDLQNQASVRLDFEDGKYCEASLQKGAAPIYTGNHKELFADVEDQDLPFLLQLTHFLNQQGNNWFVTAHGTDAGSQLEHLAIGREATEVNQLIPAAKRAAGSELQQAQREFDDINLEWQKWKELVEQRQNLTVSALTGLISVELLLEQMNGIAVKLPEFETQRHTQLLGLKVMSGELRTAIQAFVNHLKSRLNELNSLTVLVDDFHQLSINLDGSRQTLKMLQSDADKKNKALRDIENTAQQEQGLKQKSQIQINTLKETKSRINQIQLLNGQIESLEQKSVKISDELKIAEKQVADLREKLKTAEEGESRHQLLTRRSEELVKQQETLAVLKEQLKQLSDLTAIRQGILTENIPLQRGELGIFQQDLNAAKEEEKKALDILTKSESGLESLIEANDTIKKAIAVILTNYPKDRGDCPVCGEEFLPEELQRRMAETALSVNPGITAMASLVEDSRKSYELAKQKTQNIDARIKEKVSNINDLQGREKEIDVASNAIYRQYFPLYSTLEDSNSAILRLEQQINETSLKIESDKKDAGEPINPELIVILSEQMLQANERLLKLIEELHNVSVSITDAVLQRNSLSEKVKEDENEESLNASLNTANEDQAGIDRRSDELQARIRQYKDEIKQLREKILSEELQVSLLSTRLSEIKSKWTNAKLSGDPSNTILDSVVENENKRLASIEQDHAALDLIDREIGKRQTVEEEIKVELELSNIRKDVPEFIYQQNLERELANRRRRLEWVGSNIEILNEFATRLSSELKVVYERIRSVNPLWQTLLRRIIIEPRFSKTALDSYGHYKKSHASVNVTLHDGDVLVSEVASEAQITDLQLTFLLAMAQKYQWTPLKTLLLDDPTQHHDLVHASAVFDLLRDYIADHDFQILMATHDAVQARFFMRKLENDGIPVNIVMLNATENGVVPKYFN